MYELALFAGAGGGILGGKLLGWTTVGAVEIEEYPRKVLLNRQEDGHLDRFPIWDDITTFDGRPWKGAVDIISGGFPCQDISAAGKGEGIEGKRSGLWGEMARVVREVSSRFVFVENSPMLTSRGLHRVLGDLAEMGYDARWCVLGVDDAGGPHRRKRIWILGYSSMYGQSTTEERKGFNERSDQRKTRQIKDGESKRSGSSGTDEKMGNSNEMRESQQKRIEQNKRGWFSDTSKITWWESDPAEIFTGEICNSSKSGFQNRGRAPMGRSEEITESKRSDSEKRESWTVEPKLGRVAHGVANRVDRLKGIGNGQSPGVAAIAFTILSEGLV